MIRVLQCVNDMQRAGLETVLMNYYRNIDRKKVQFDFLTHRPYKSDYDEEILSLGGNVYYAPRLYPQNYPKYFSWMKHFFQVHPEYKVIHSHIDAMSYLPLKAAKKAGIPVRIAHSHNSSVEKDFKYILKQYFRRRLCSTATDFCACGDDAGKYLFGNIDYTVIPNAIDGSRFYYNPEIREQKRTALGIKNEIVIGHVGRIEFQKNHKLLIKIFAQYLQYNSNSILLLIGVGEKEEKIRKQVKEFGIQEKVRFLGKRDDVNELYQVMDVFVMPSFFEGVPVVGIEAQFAGLPCVFSNRIPHEVKFCKNVKFVDLNAPVEEWIKAIEKQRRTCRGSVTEALETSLYNMKQAHQILENYYFERIGREENHYGRSQKYEAYFASLHGRDGCDKTYCKGDFVERRR